MVEPSPTPPARTHSSTSESLKRKRRPTLWAGSRFLSTHRYTESLFTPRWVATSSTLTQRSSAVILVLPRWAMARNSDLNQRKPTTVYEGRQALQEGTGRNSGLVPRLAGTEIDGTPLSCPRKDGGVARHGPHSACRTSRISPSRAAQSGIVLSAWYALRPWRITAFTPSLTLISTLTCG